MHYLVGTNLQSPGKPLPSGSQSTARELMVIYFYFNRTHCCNRCQAAALCLHLTQKVQQLSLSVQPSCLTQDWLLDALLGLAAGTCSQLCPTNVLQICGPSPSVSDSGKGVRGTALVSSALHAAFHQSLPWTFTYSSLKLASE